MMSAHVVSTDRISSTVAVTSGNEDSGISSTAIENEISIFFDVLTSSDSSSVVLVTTNTLRTNRINSTTILPAMTSILSTLQMDSTTFLPSITRTNGDTNSTVINRPTDVPSGKDSSSSSKVGVIVGAVGGGIILITAMTCIVGFIVVRKKRVKRKYQIDWTQAGDY